MPSFVEPNETLSKLGLDEHMSGADFGCGSGGWALPLARILKKGIIFAVDIQESALSSLEGKAKSVKQKNIRRVLADVEQGVPLLKEMSLDIVLMTNLLFQVEDKKAVFREASRVLKPKGKILAVEWRQGALMGPKTDIPSREEIRNLGKEAGFSVEKEFEAGDYHFAVIFKK